MFKYTYILFCAVVALGLISVSRPLWAGEPSPVEILKAVDQYRGYSSPFTVTITIQDFEGETPLNRIEFFARIKSIKDTHLIYTAPAKDKGKMFLMSGETLWFYQPNLQKPIRISARQRLLGNISNGDVARANYSEDYVPTIVSRENGQLKLALAAKTEAVPYKKILLWIEAQTYKPLKGEYYAVSGRLLKTATFTKFKVYGNHERVAELSIVDGVMTSKKSLLLYHGYTPKALDDYYFNVDYLPRLQ